MFILAGIRDKYLWYPGVDTKSKSIWILTCLRWPWQVCVHGGACSFCLFHSLFCFFLNYYLYVPPVNFLLLFSPCAFFFFFVLSKTKAFEFLLACLRWPWCQVRVHGACTFCLFHSVFYFFLTYCLYVPVNFLLLFFPLCFFLFFCF